MSILRLAALSLALTLVSGPARAATIDFEAIAVGTVEGMGFVDSGVTITSLAGSHQGITIFDSNDPTGGDADLGVGLGNVLILQDSTRPDPVGGFHAIPDDDADGGTIVFSFSIPSFLQSLDLIDLDNNAGATVTLIDGGGNEREYSAPDGWTGDVAVDGAPGWASLDLTTLLDQVAPASGSGVATAIEDAGFNPNDVRTLVVDFGGSAALDNLTFIPEPGTAFLLGGGLALLGLRRRIA